VYKIPFGFCDGGVGFAPTSSRGWIAACLACPTKVNPPKTPYFGYAEAIAFLCNIRSKRCNLLLFASELTKKSRTAFFANVSSMRKITLKVQ